MSTAHRVQRVVGANRRPSMSVNSATWLPRVSSKQSSSSSSVQRDGIVGEGGGHGDEVAPFGVLVRDVAMRATSVARLVG